jgi:hypothetical protein
VSLVSPDEERLLAGIERFIKRDLNASPLPEMAAQKPIRSVVAVDADAIETPLAASIQVDSPVNPWLGRRRAEPVCALLLPPANAVAVVASPVPAALQA